MVIEAKANASQITIAVDEAQWYADACMESCGPVIAVGVAGQEKEAGIKVSVTKRVAGKWTAILYGGRAVSWIPRPENIDRLVAGVGLVDLAPIIPSADVLAKRADLINRILREAHVKDEYRPAYVGAMMLALWQSKGALRRSPEDVLADINSACERAFSKARKAVLAKSIHVDEANGKLLRTHHGVSQQHLQAYLNEFVFRFNRRFYPMTAFNSVLGIATRVEAPTYEALYSGEKTYYR